MKLNITENPLNSSPLEEYLELKKDNKGIPYTYRDKKDGKLKQTYFKIFNDQEKNLYIEKNPELKPNQQDLKTEHMVSLLIKGIFHSSDIIKKNNKYFSKVINLNKTEKSQYGEIEAEIFLLRYIFSDWDKNAPSHNINIKNKHFAHYDYSEAFRGVFEKYFKLENKTENLIHKTENELNYISEYNEPWGLKRKGKTLLSKIGIPLRKKEPLIEKQVKEKSEELLLRIKDDTFWNAIIKKSEFDTKNSRFDFLKSENKIEELRNILKERLEKIIEIIQKRNTNES